MLPHLFTYDSLSITTVQNGNNTATITTNKTGTLNTKAVTASQLATNSPILPHKMNGNNPPKEPPALPPRGVSIRSRDVKPPPPAVPPKRSSLTRSDLALFTAENVRFIYQVCIIIENQSINTESNQLIASTGEWQRRFWACQSTRWSRQQGLFTHQDEQLGKLQ